MPLVACPYRGRFPLLQSPEWCCHHPQCGNGQADRGRRRKSQPVRCPKRKMLCLPRGRQALRGPEVDHKTLCKVLVSKQLTLTTFRLVQKEELSRDVQRVTIIRYIETMA